MKMKTKYFMKKKRKKRYRRYLAEETRFWQTHMKIQNRKKKF